MPNFENEIEKFKKGCPLSWEVFPDIDLYMDQVISYLSRQPITLREEEKLTSSMINNYIKEGILPRANGKRYGREHLAYLTMIVRLKQILSVKDTGELIKTGMERGSIEDFYSEFVKVFCESGKCVASTLQDEEKNKDLEKLALFLAVNSYFNKIACEHIIDLIREENEEKEKTKKSEKKKKKE